MKKELKLLGKYIGLSILITVFVLQIFTQVVDKISAYIDLQRLSSFEASTSEEVVTHLESIEASYSNFAQATDELSKEMASRGYANYPAMGAMIQWYQSSNVLYSGLYELAFYISLGILIGIIYYLAKKEFKKPIHYVFVFGLIFIVLCLLAVMYNYISFTAFFGGYGSYELDWEILGETMRDNIIPYSIICIITYIIICIIGKKKADMLNKEINK